MFRLLARDLTIGVWAFALILAGCTTQGRISPISAGSVNSGTTTSPEDPRSSILAVVYEEEDLDSTTSDDAATEPQHDFSSDAPASPEEQGDSDQPNDPDEQGTDDQEADDEGGDAAEEESPAGLLSFIPHTVGPLTGSATYQGEVYTNTRGGMNTNKATRYRGNLDLTIDGDLDELFSLKGTSFFLYGGQVHGESISTKDVGDWQILSEIDPAPFVQVTQLHEYWLKQEFLDGQVYFKLGRQDANADFGFADLAGDFVNNSFVTIPTIPFPVWPSQSLGASGFVALSDDLTLGAGIYESNRINWLWGDSVASQQGQIALGHLEWKTQTGPNGQLPGTWRAGAWLDTGNWNEITTAPVSKVFDNNYGFWSSGDQLLFKEQYGTNDEQGLGVFYEFGWAPDDRNFVQEYYGAGVVYRGLIPGRDLDSLGVGMADIRFGQATRDRDGLVYENVTEVFYKAQINDFLKIQPDLQFIANPGGNGRDALVVGIRFEMAL